MDGIFSVTELNQAVNERLAKDPVLGKVRVRGEISGLKKYPSGHHYFTLKDDYASVSCVLFRQAAHQAPSGLADGMQVLLLARTNLYDKSGRFQLIVDSVQEEGVGDLYRRFVELKERLSREGLFDSVRKRPLPFLPRRVIAVTSEAGAVIRDIMHVLRRRFPGIRLILIPVPVQGPGAEREIAAAIEIANHLDLGDVMIVGRGGGSQEDLQPFNEEITARAIAASRIPVVSAVGHETDFTISDFAADLRAPTPSAAAELVVPVKDDLLLRLNQLAVSMEQALAGRLDAAIQKVESLASRPALRDPVTLIDRQRSRVDLAGHRLTFIGSRLIENQDRRKTDLSRRLGAAMEQMATRETHRLDRACETLEALSPMAVLARGYTVVTDEKGQTVTRAGSLSRGDGIEVLFSDGRVGCEVLYPWTDAQESSMKES